MLTLPDPPSAGGAMDGQRVYIPLSSGRIVGLDRKTGEMVWMREIESAWPPVADGDTIYVAASDELHALDAETGDTKWRSPIEHMAIAPRSASGAVVVVMIDPDDVVALRRSDGTQVWRMSAGTSGTRSLAIGAAVYVTGSEGQVVALSLEDGQKLWNQTLPPMLSPPATALGRVFVGSTNNSLYALDARTGNLAWPWRSGGDVIGAAANRDMVFYASLDNIVRALNRGNGNQRWKKPTPTRPVLPPRIVRDDVLIIGLDPTLSTFDTKTGTPGGTFSAPAALAGEPLIDPDFHAFEVAAVIVMRDGRVVALRPQSIAYTEAATVPLAALPGKPVTRERTPEAIAPPPSRSGP
jgi:outer membrane protein assembly factor BamB